MSDIVASQPTLTLAGAQRAVEAARVKAEELGVPVNIAVADAGGHELAFVRMDGAALLSIGIAIDKAYSVAAFNGLPTDQWWDAIKDEPGLANGIVHRDRLVIFGGGAPVRVDGALVGAVGVSGGTAEEDRAIAEAGAAALA